MKLQFLILLFLSLGNIQAQLFKDSIKVIDYHVHIFSPALMDNLSLQGYDFKKSRFQIIKDSTAYSDIEQIAEDNEYAKMVLISTGYAHKKIGNGLSEKDFVKKENNLLAELVKSDPENLLGFYGIDPLQEFAVEEIKRCNEELKLDGIKLHLQANNLNLKDSTHLTKLKRIFQLADKRGIPLLVHNNAWDNSFGKAYFKIFIEELLDTNDSLTIIFAHAGGGGGFFQFGYDFLNQFDSYFRESKVKAKHRIYFELSSVAKVIKYPKEKSHAELLEIMQKIGYDKFIFGSDYPVSNTPTYLEELSKLLKIEKDQLINILQRDIFENLGANHNP